MYFWGWHVPKDYEKAYKYFAKLNKKGVKGTNYYMVWNDPEKREELLRWHDDYISHIKKKMRFIDDVMNIVKITSGLVVDKRQRDFLGFKS